MAVPVQRNDELIRSCFVRNDDDENTAKRCITSLIRQRSFDHDDAHPLLCFVKLQQQNNQSLKTTLPRITFPVAYEAA